MEIHTGPHGILASKTVKKRGKRVGTRPTKRRQGLGPRIEGAEPPIKLSEAIDQLRGAFRDQVRVTGEEGKEATVTLRGGFRFTLRESNDGAHAISDVNGKRVDFGRITSQDQGEKLRSMINKMKRDTDKAESSLSKNGGSVAKASFSEGVTLRAKKKGTVKPSAIIPNLKGRSKKKSDIDENVRPAREREFAFA